MDEGDDESAVPRQCSCSGPYPAIDLLQPEDPKLRGIIHGFREKLKNSGITMPLGIFSTSLFYILSKIFNPGQIFIWTAGHSSSSIQVFTGSLVFI